VQLETEQGRRRPHCVARSYRQLR